MAPKFEKVCSKLKCIGNKKKIGETLQMTSTNIRTTIRNIGGVCVELLSKIVFSNITICYVLKKLFIFLFN